MYSLSVAVETDDGRAALIVGPDALVTLGSLCLHAATNEPLGETAAIPVLSVLHQEQPNGWQTLGFRVPGDLMFFLCLEPKGAEALRDMLTTAIGPMPPQDSVPRGQRN
jgi:hypothetical protein